jgi:hypothetical protein
LHADPSQPFLKELINAGYKSYPPTERGHYVVLYELDPNRPITPLELDRRLECLEEQFESFYYLFAMQGVRLPMPAYRLAVVLEPSRFKTRHEEWGLLPPGGDSFTPRRENVVIAEAKRRDKVFAALDAALPPLIKRTRKGENGDPYSVDEIMSGSLWKKDFKGNHHYIFVLQTLLIVHRAMIEEAERAALTYGASRQLVAASGLLPRGLRAPEWIVDGLGSFFETPLYAFHPGPGMPSWTHLVHFKHLRKTGQLGAPEEVFKRTVSDSYFIQARRLLAEGKEQKDPELTEKGLEILEIGRTTSWALVFYLARSKQFKLLDSYCAGLRKLPRDLDLEPRLLDKVWQNAFPVGDDAALKRFSGAWFDEMATVSLDVPRVEEDLMHMRAMPPSSSNVP